MERSMLNIKRRQKINHTKIRANTNAIDALSHSQKMKWKWAGHIARLQDDRWTKTVTFWTGPLARRYRGRRFTRWEDDIKKITGPQWKKIALEREKWKALEEALT